MSLTSGPNASVGTATDAGLPAISGGAHRSIQLFFVLVALLLVASTAWHILFSALNPDEGFYAAAARATVQGEVPYRDFGFTQPPLVPYLNGLVLRFVGFGLFEQRFINGVWSGVALVLAGCLLARRSCSFWGLALVAAFSLSSPWMYFMNLGKTYAITSLLVMTATWIFLQMPAAPRRSFWLCVVAMFGIGARLPAAPFFSLLCLFSLFTGGRPAIQRVIAGVVGATLGFSFVGLPFCLVAPAEIKFWIFDFHRISVPNKQWHLAWSEIVTLAPALWLLTAVTAVVSWRNIAKARRETGLLVASLITLALNLLPGGVYEEYGTPFLLPLAVSAGALLYQVEGSWKSFARSFLIGSLIVAQAVTAPLVLWTTLPQRRATANWWLTPKALDYNFDLPRQLSEARAAAAGWLGAARTMAGPNIILATELNLPLAAELRMGPFSATSEMSPARAAALHLATPQRLATIFKNPNTGVLVFFNRALLNYAWSMPSFNNVPISERKPWVDIFHRDYSIIYQEGDFLVLGRNK